MPTILHRLADFAKRVIETVVPPSPIPMLLRCPDCNEQHIDRGEFATLSHRTHQCEYCGRKWRPASVPTVGVYVISPTERKRVPRDFDSPLIVSPPPPPPPPRPNAELLEELLAHPIVPKLAEIPAGYHWVVGEHQIAIVADEGCDYFTTNGACGSSSLFNMLQPKLAAARQSFFRPRTEYWSRAIELASDGAAVWEVEGSGNYDLTYLARIDSTMSLVFPTGSARPNIGNAPAAVQRVVDLYNADTRRLRDASIEFFKRYQPSTLEQEQIDMSADDDELASWRRFATSMYYAAIERGFMRNQTPEKLLACFIENGLVPGHGPAAATPEPSDAPQ